MCKSIMRQYTTMFRCKNKENIFLRNIFTILLNFKFILKLFKKATIIIYQNDNIWRKTKFKEIIKEQIFYSNLSIDNIMCTTIRFHQFVSIFGWLNCDEWLLFHWWFIVFFFLSFCHYYVAYIYPMTIICKPDGQDVLHYPIL